MKLLSVATLNTFTITLHPRSLFFRFKALSHFFNHSDLQVLYLQEVFTYAHLYLLKSQLIKFQFYCFEPSLIGPKGGLVIFSRFPIYKKEYQIFDTTFAPRGKASLEKILKKGILVACTKSKIYFVNTHLSAIIDGDYSRNGKYTRVLESQIMQLHKVISNYSRNICIIAGDFNLAKDSLWYQVLLNRDNLQDVFKDEDSVTMHPEFLSSKQRAHWIDYVLVNTPENWIGGIADRKLLFKNKVVLTKRQKDFISDHLGLQVSLSI